MAFARTPLSPCGSRGVHRSVDHFKALAHQPVRRGLGQPRVQGSASGLPVAAAASETCRPSLTPAITALYGCSATLESFIRRVSRISRSRCQPSPETPSGIRRSPNVNHEPNAYKQTCKAPAGFEAATPALGSRICPVLRVLGWVVTCVIACCRGPASDLLGCRVPQMRPAGRGSDPEELGWRVPRRRR